AETVTFADPWASAAEAGMTAVFGTLQNSGNHDAHIVSATSPTRCARRGFPSSATSRTRLSCRPQPHWPTDRRMSRSRP
ncbi:copper chaperone PCu(A)C, partial [Mycolicibacterium goodii]|nr:copper chaperone PCu(A)C [Mycolicibacterium goodii]